MRQICHSVSSNCKKLECHYLIGGRELCSCFLIRCPVLPSFYEKKFKNFFSNQHQQTAYLWVLVWLMNSFSCGLIKMLNMISLDVEVCSKWENTPLPWFKKVLPVKKIFTSNDTNYPGNSFYKNLQMIINNLFIS